MEDINVFNEFVESIQNDQKVEKKDENMIQQNDLAKAFVVWQELGDVFCPEEGLMQGTIFPELVRPYKKWRDLRHG